MKRRRLEGVITHRGYAEMTTESNVNSEEQERTQAEIKRIQTELEGMIEKITAYENPGLVLEALKRAIENRFLVMIAWSIQALPKPFLELLAKSLIGIIGGTTFAGYGSYEEYLSSLHWKETRSAALSKAGGKCCICNAESDLNVHHKTYERLGAERDDDLVVLCKQCHLIFHKGQRLPEVDEEEQAQ